MNLLDSVYDEHWQGHVLGEVDGWRWLALEYGFNMRLIGVVAGEDQTGYEWGWCFRKDLSWVRFWVRQWDPATQDEPLGWHKRPTGLVVRKAPRRTEDPEHNRERCVHGTYLDDGRCGIAEVCDWFPGVRSVVR